MARDQVLDFKTVPELASGKLSLLENLAEFHRANNRHEEALHFYELALNKLDSNNQDDIESTERLLFIIAEQLAVQKNYAKARDYYMKIFELKKSKIGENHNQYLKLCENISAAYEQEDNFTESLRYLLQGLLACHKTPNQDSSYIDTLYDKVDRLTERLTNLQKGIEIYEKVVQIMKRKGHEDYFCLSKMHASLGLLYFRQGAYTKSGENLKISLEKIPVTMENTHYVHRENLLKYLGKVCSNTGELEMGLSYVKNHMETKMRRLGLCHQEIIPVFVDMGKMYAQQKKDVDAMRYYKQALRMMAKLGVSQDINFVEVYSLIGCTYTQYRKWKEALRYFTKGLKIMKKNKSNLRDHSLIVEMYKNIGYTFYNMEDFGESVKFFSKGLRLEREAIGFKNSKNLDIYLKVACLYELQGKDSKAYNYFMHAFLLQKKLFGDNHLCTQSTLWRLEKLEMKMKRIL